MSQISGIIVGKSGRDYSGNMENAHGLKTERKNFSLMDCDQGATTPSYGAGRLA